MIPTKIYLPWRFSNARALYLPFIRPSCGSLQQGRRPRAEARLGLHEILEEASIAAVNVWFWRGALHEY